MSGGYDEIYVDAGIWKNKHCIAGCSKDNRIFQVIFEDKKRDLEFLAIQKGIEYINPNGIIYSDCKGAIAKARKLHLNISISYIKSCKNKAHKFASKSIKRPKRQKLRKIKETPREQYKNIKHYVLVRTIEGDVWMTMNQFKKYHSTLFKK